MDTSPKHPQTARMFSALLAALDVSASKLAKDISLPGEEYSQQVISNYVAGKFKPGQEVLAAIVRRYPAIDAKWLLTGEGQPFPTGRYNEKPAQAAATQSIEPTAAPVAAPAPGLVSGSATVAEAENILLREIIASKDEIITILKEELGKPFDSSDAADAPEPTDPTPKAPTGQLPQPMLHVQVRGYRRYQE